MLKTIDQPGPTRHLVQPPRPGWVPGPGLVCAVWTAIVAALVAFWVTVAVILARVA